MRPPLLHALDVTLVRYLPGSRRPMALTAAAAATFAASFALIGATPLRAQAQQVRLAAETGRTPSQRTEILPSAANGPLRVVFGSATLAAPAKREAYRDPADGEVYVAPEALAPLGVTHIVDEKDGTATFLVNETGKSVTVGLRPAPEGGERTGLFVPAVKTIEGLGGKCQFEQKTGTLHVRAVLTDVQMLGGQLRIQASFPVTPKITSTNGNRLVIIDVPAAEVGALPKTLSLADPNVDKARSGQFQEDVARVVLETRNPAAFLSLAGDRPVAQMVLNPVPTTQNARQKPIVITNKPASPGAVPAVRTASSGKPSSQKAPPPPTLIRAVAFEKVSDTQARIILRAGSAPSAVPSQGDGRLVFSLPNATLAAGAGDGLESARHPFLRGAELIARSATQAQLALSLTRSVIFSVRMEPGRGLVIDLGLPRGAGGKVAGKTIIVDAGHGGGDAGARGVNGSYEKNVNLAVARKVAEDLREMDANVIMTRDTDAFVTLGNRSFIANRAGADFFLSIHADSARGGVRGSTVYYHANLPSSRTLAQCIADRFDKMGGIPTKGARSDYKLYPGDGLSVLRRSQMVAVLVECGYMSNGADVALLNQKAMQEKIARAISDGLRDYVEGNPDVDTRFLNPRGIGDNDGVSALPPVGGPLRDMASATWGMAAVSTAPAAAGEAAGEAVPPTQVMP